MMDGNEKEGAQRFYNKCYYLFFHNFTLRLLHLLLPMAILLSFFLTFTSYNSYHYNHLSVFLLPLFTHTFEKKYLFILCTSILAFITNNNQHLGPKENIHHDDGATILEENLQEFEYDYEYGKLDEQESKEEHGKTMENNEKESGVLMEDEEDDGEVFEEEGLLGGSSCVEDEQEEMNMDTEELNEKIEEFIRKMRQELRVEAQQHLIIV